MTNATADPSGSGTGAGCAFHSVQAERDLESNWELDLGTKLEEYLLRICSGELPAEADGIVSINFAEAALLVQGSVQVYSRKVEYLYSLVLRALEFLSQKRQVDQSEGTSAQPEEGGSSNAVGDEENDRFWGLDDIAVEAKNCLDSPSGRDVHSDLFVKPPVNLVVLEGDCLDTTSDSGELESYLLATHNLYQDFILLDPCDGVALNDYLGVDGVTRGQSSAHRASSTRKSFLSPTRRSGGTLRKSQMFHDANVNQSPRVDSQFEVNGCNIGPDPRGCNDFDEGTHGYDMDDRYSEPGDLDESGDDDDDPWKPLNPHEPGNLKVRPFKKVKALRRKGINSTKQASMVIMFPPAKFYGPISPELTEMWELRRHAQEQQRGSQSPPLFEKLRQSLIDGTHETFDGSSNPMNGNDEAESDNDIPGFTQQDADIPEDVPLHNDENEDGGPHFGTNEDFGYEDPNPHASLEDLCRSHLIVGAENPVLMSAVKQIFSAGGKRMRPALVFLVSRAIAEIVGLEELTKEHRRLAEIIEMIHTASLIHDNVLDESDMRRGKETVHQMFGTRVAVLAGDFMFAQSSWYLANLENLPVIKLISQVIKDFASGEIKQASSLFDCDVKLDEYLIKSYYKTASLIAASTKGAAIFSGVDNSVAEKMYDYGNNLGLSFQVVDDILDFTQSAEQLGKPAATDLAKGNLTAPVIFALEKEPKLRDIIESEFSETGSLNEAIELVKSCGGIEQAQELAKELAYRAIQNLECLPRTAFRLALEDMVMFNLDRID